MCEVLVTGLTCACYSTGRLLQVDFVKLLHDKLMEMSLRYADTPDEWRFPRPSFKVRWAGLGWLQQGQAGVAAGHRGRASRPAHALHFTACRLTVLPAAPLYCSCRW